MPIIVPSNHTIIGAWVNSKMSGRNPRVYSIIPLIAMQGYHTQKTRGARCYITSRIGWVSMKGVYRYSICSRSGPGKILRRL